MKKKNIITTLMITGVMMSLLPNMPTVQVNAASKANAESWSNAESKEVAAIAQTESTEDSEETTETSSKKYLQIGSVSKVYTATAVMQLVDQGKVDLDAPLTDYITDFKMADERYKDITVRMCLNHTSGLMGSVYAGMFEFDNKSTEYHDSFLTKLSKERLKYTPGEYNCYCNDGFTLLEILVERVSGMNFTDYLEKNISEPLGLTNTGTIWSMTDIDGQVPIYLNGDVRMKTYSAQLFGTGGISSDAEELCTVGTTFFKGNETLLSENAKNSMAESQATETAGYEWGLGWDEVSISDYEAAGVKVLEKGGDTDFQHASLTVAPDEDISIAVISSGGSSGVNEDLAKDLMDIALEEKGIKVEHAEKKAPETKNQIPDELLKFEGIYTIGNMLLEVTFPEGKYMHVRSLLSENGYEEQDVYTENGTFIKVSGDVESGNAIPVKPYDEMSFETVNGKDYLREADGEYQAEKIADNKISDAAQKAWDERNGVKYYYISGNPGDSWYLASSCITLNTYEELKGYVNEYTILDENHAENRTNIPGMKSRDLTDIEISDMDGCEILTQVEMNASYISEKNISDFTRDISKVETKSGEATWYKLSGEGNVTVSFDIPENAAVYVYDKLGNVTYTNYMKDYKGGVPLPDYGMMVFVGETGATIGISR